MQLKSRSILIALSIITCTLSSLSLFNQSIRLDESQQIWISTKSTEAILSFIATDVHVPLYAILLHFWMQVFGSSIIAARIPSFMFFLATLPILYVLYKEASNEKIALIGTVAFSFSPFILWYSSEARMYTLFTLTASINALYFLRLIRTNGRTGKMGYFLSEILGLYSHYFFLFILITQTTFVLGKYIVLIARHQQYDRHGMLFFLQEYIKQIAKFLAVMIAGIIFLLPWLLYLTSLGGSANTQPLIPPPSTFNLFEILVNFVFGFPGGPIQAVLISLWPILVVMLFFVFTRKDSRLNISVMYFLLSAFLPIFLTYALSFIRPIFLARYLIFVLPSVFFLISWMLFTYTEKFQKFAVASFLILLLTAEVYQNFSPATTVKEDYTDIAHYLSVHASASDIVVVTPPFTIYPIEYSYSGLATLSSIPEWDVNEIGPIPPFSLPKLKEQIKIYTTRYSRLFVVFSYDQGYQKSIISYLDTHYQRLGEKTFSQGLELRVYQLRYDIGL